MSREIKFRAWQDNRMLTQKSSGVYATKNFLDQLYEDCDLMQFTGYLDAKGVEIYEHDIIRCSPSETNMARFVEWVGGEFLLITADLESTFPIGVVTSSHDKAVVVGNIHENPDLLTKEAGA